ncbi:hemerythrin domain-containing protein [Aquabacterium sp.]|uniref:hemerythrin domain-containing protein n=1 Tax=Aquabacterium sp. TaxID=1872578 RepID=UPI002E321CBE|nr:hemerythrin domain-containing protein [Aquabacterium sp.]HEX5310544.1 hemerythrin domain-containing protein [Aquabacterium sp.]
MPVTATSTPADSASAEISNVEPFEVLDATHQQIVTALQQLTQLVSHLRENGVDRHAQDTAKSLFLFFMNTARQHHLDEEKHVFPQLISSGDDQLIHTTLRLQQDHGWIEEDWLELAPQIESISAGYNWYNIEQLEHAVPVFAALYHDHMRLEESLIYPEARARISSWNLKSMGREMAARRRPGRLAA